MRTPRYLRDNIHVDLLATAYARFVAEVAAGGAGRRFGPCGYMETQGAFAERLGRELAPRLGLAGRVSLAEQTDFSEPLARVNRDVIDPAAYGWDEGRAWDALADYYRGAMRRRLASGDLKRRLRPRHGRAPHSPADSRRRDRSGTNRRSRSFERTQALASMNATRLSCRALATGRAGSA